MSDMEYVKLKDITTKITKGTTPSYIGASFTDEGINYFRSEMLGKAKYLDKSSGMMFISESTHNKLKRSQIEADDILFSMAGIYLGKLAIVKDEDVPANTNQAVALIRFNKGVNIDYLYYFMVQKCFNAYVNCMSSQAAQPNINLKQIGNLQIALPNDEQQKGIADILSTYDNLIENNNKRIRLLEQMAENLYKEWFVRFRFPGYEDVEFENGIPKSWEIKRLFEFGKIETGKTPSKERDQNYGGDIMFIKTPDLHDNIYVISTDEFLSIEGHLTQPKKLLPENSIMVSCIGTGGVVAINDRPAHTNQQINSIILSKSEYLEWLYFVCKNLKEIIEMFGATGSTMTNLSKGKFEKLKIVTPPEKLILEYRELTKNLFIEVRVLLHKNDLLAKQRDMLLPRLMSGKLEV